MGSHLRRAPWASLFVTSSLSDSESFERAIGGASELNLLCRLGLHDKQVRYHLAENGDLLELVSCSRCDKWKPKRHHRKKHGRA